MGRIVQRPRYSVKNTVVELRPPCQADCTKAECAFSQAELASLEGDCAKTERTFVQAEEYLGSLEAIDENTEAACVPSLANWTEGCCGHCSGCLGASGDSVPSTPSPMLRPTLLPPGMGYLPPLDLGLPPACGLSGFHEQGVPGVYIPALPYSCGFYLPQGFTLGEQDQTSGAAAAGWSTETESCELDSLAMASVQTELLLEALSDKIKESREACGQARERLLDEPEGEQASIPALAPPPTVVPSTVSPLVEAAEVGTPEERAARRERAGDERCVPEQAPAHSAASEGTNSSPTASTATAARAEPPWQPSERGRSGKRQLRRREVEAKDSGRGSSAADEKPIGFTTVMLRNIPNKYTRDMLVSQLNLHLRAKYDFVYLPMDFKNGCNVGYGFINFRSCEACKAFVNRFSGVDVCKCLPGINNSSKVAEVTPARVQGLDENVRRLRSSPVMQELVNHPEWMPLVFDEEGVESPLPLPEGPLPPIKPKGRMRGK